MRAANTRNLNKLSAKTLPKNLKGEPNYKPLPEVVITLLRMNYFVIFKLYANRNIIQAY